MFTVGPCVVSEDLQVHSSFVVAQFVARYVANQALEALGFLRSAHMDGVLRWGLTPAAMQSQGFASSWVLHNPRPALRFDLDNVPIRDQTAWQLLTCVLWFLFC